ERVAVYVGVGVLLAREDDVEADGDPARLLHALVGGLHDSGPAAGDHAVALLHECPADRDAHLVVGRSGRRPRRAEDAHAWSDPPHHFVALDELPHDAENPPGVLDAGLLPGIDVFGLHPHAGGEGRLHGSRVRWHGARRYHPQGRRRKPVPPRRRSPTKKGPRRHAEGPFGLGEERSASAPLLALELLAVLLVRVERDLDAAVLLPAGLGRVRGDGLALAHARDLHPARRDALLRVVRRGGVRAALRERLVVVLGARRV